MSDGYSSRAVTASSTARRVAAVTPDDDTDLASVAKALYVGGGGDVELIAAGDSAAVVFANVPAGSTLPVQVRRVREENTTATSMLALYD
jgi:hypothetical protein